MYLAQSAHTLNVGRDEKRPAETEHEKLCSRNRAALAAANTTREQVRVYTSNVYDEKRVL